jgi:hypothetical protein
MRHGVGSMSVEDVEISIPNDSMVAPLQRAVASGKIINARTNEARWRWCNKTKELAAFQVIEEDAKP